MSLALLDAPISGLLDTWADLTLARFGVSPFGGDTCELYAYRLLRDQPWLRMGQDSNMHREAMEENGRAASDVLHALLCRLKTEHDCAIEVDGVRWTPATAPAPNAHRWHVRVTLLSMRPQ